MRSSTISSGGPQARSTQNVRSNGRRCRSLHAGLGLTSRLGVRKPFPCIEQPEMDAIKLCTDIAVTKRSTLGPVWSFLSEARQLEVNTGRVMVLGSHPLGTRLTFCHDSQHRGVDLADGNCGNSGKVRRAIVAVWQATSIPLHTLACNSSDSTARHYAFPRRSRATGRRGSSRQ